MGVADINRDFKSGRLTKNSELKYSSGGLAILNFSLAYTRNIKKGDAWEDKSCFINCVMFGKRAESLSELLVKGKQVFVDGELDWQSWEKDGVKHSAHSLIVTNIIMASDGKKSGDNSSTGQEAPPAEENDFDVPF